MKCSDLKRTGVDAKRHWSSRPSSTVSYSRNDAPAYPPSPAVEQSIAVPVALTHSEAMERFNVSGLLTFSGYF
jgi:CCR4-NOT transcription complex subunit 1